MFIGASRLDRRGTKRPPLRMVMQIVSVARGRNTSSLRKKAARGTAAGFAIEFIAFGL
jgi:hypothetical protein